MIKKIWLYFVVLCFVSAVINCAPPNDVVYSKDSKFGLIEVVKLYDNNILHICVDKNYGLTFSSFVKDDPSILACEYESLAFNGFAFNPNTKNILLLGLGAGEFLGYTNHYLKNVKVDAVEINDALISIVRDYRKLNSKNNNLICDDAFKYVAKKKAKYKLFKYDLIFSDIYFTKPSDAKNFIGFFKNVKRLMNKDAVFVFNAFVFFTPRSVMQEMFAEFDHVTAQNTQGEHNIIFICYQGAKKTTEQLVNASKTLQVKYNFRYCMPELVSKVIYIDAENNANWLKKFPEL